MNNFGVIEIAGGRTTKAPGWAYVPDVGPSPAQAALQPINRKRAARNQSALSLSDVSARQDAKIRKDIEALDRDVLKDVNIPIPPKPGGSRANKHTPNVRKILQSQKTFANHLDDYQALLALAETNPAAAAALNPANAPQPKPAPPPPTARNSPAPPPPPAAPPTAASKRSAAAAKRAAAKEAEEAARAKAQAEAEARVRAEAEAQQQQQQQPEPGPSPDNNDVTMTDAPLGAGPDTAPTGPSVSSRPPTPAAPEEPQSYPPDGTILPAYRKPPPKPHPGDDDPLLISAVPPFPTDEELRGLMTAPPLSYLEARATWGEEETRYPVRTFCEICGYWGRVRCMKCGARVCALDCLEAHKAECVTRYGL